jgi:hypothetical protein
MPDGVADDDDDDDNNDFGDFELDAPGAYHPPSLGGSEEMTTMLATTPLTGIHALSPVLGTPLQLTADGKAKKVRSLQAIREHGPIQCGMPTTALSALVARLIAINRSLPKSLTPPLLDPLLHLTVRSKSSSVPHRAPVVLVNLVSLVNLVNLVSLVNRSPFNLTLLHVIGSRQPSVVLKAIPTHLDFAQHQLEPSSIKPRKRRTRKLLVDKITLIR